MDLLIIVNLRTVFTVGVDFLSEAFVFSIAGTIIVYEYSKSEVKNAEKAAKALKEKEDEKAYIEERLNLLLLHLHDIESSLPKKSKVSMIL